MRVCEGKMRRTRARLLCTYAALSAGRLRSSICDAVPRRHDWADVYRGSCGMQSESIVAVCACDRSDAGSDARRAVDGLMRAVLGLRFVYGVTRRIVAGVTPDTRVGATAVGAIAAKTSSASKFADDRDGSAVQRGDGLQDRQH
jgi:hypothetical protein